MGVNTVHIDMASDNVLSEVLIIIQVEKEVFLTSLVVFGAVAQHMATVERKATEAFSLWGRGHRSRSDQHMRRCQLRCIQSTLLNKFAGRSRPSIAAHYLSSVMASLLPGFIVFSLLAGVLHGQLSPSFYATTCPNLQTIVRSVMAQAVSQEPRMGASILRLFFHDCFVNGCDASILLDDTANFTGEKNAAPNANSVRGYEVIDAIKTRVEAACNATVSCADIVALAARDGVYLLGGPTWAVPLGRRDARTASQDAANSNLPGPFSSLATLISMFDAKGLSAQDMTALSGAHTIGMARCGLFRSRIFNDANVNASFAAERKLTCPATGGDGNLAPLDVATPNLFDSSFYRNLVAARGLLHSDQELYNGGSQDALVRNYSVNATAFASDFSSAMVKLGYLSPLTGKNGEIRLNCRKAN